MDELELILTDIFKCSRTELYLNSRSLAFKNKELKTLEKILKDRGRLKPIQYILGHAEFMGLRLNVKKGVLIPRPETEILVETAINKVKELRLKTKDLKLKILDIGTGSGCIAISLVKFLQNTHLVAIDVSNEALNLARENARTKVVFGGINWEDLIILEQELFAGTHDLKELKDQIIQKQVVDYDLKWFLVEGGAEAERDAHPPGTPGRLPDPAGASGPASSV